MAEDLLFVLKDITYTPEMPREKEPFTVKGKIELLKIPFVAPIWVIAKVTYPESWWEEIVPIIGSPTVAEGDIALGGDFEIKFPKGFDREGEFILDVEAYAGPTLSLDKITIPPFPPVASEQTTFIVAGEVPEEELGFRNFRILSYAKNGGTPVSPPEVLELDVGDRLQIKLGFDHQNLAVTGKIHAAIWQETFVDPHDEVLNKEKSFGVPASDDWEPYEEGIEIIITSDIAPGTEYGLYAKIMGITGGDMFTDYLENVITIIGPPEVGFDLTKPTADPQSAPPGPVLITCPVTSLSSKSVTAQVKLIVYEGSALPEHGTKLWESTQAITISPNETKNVQFGRTSEVGTIDRRDVEVEVYVEGRLIKESEWDDVFYVRVPEAELELLEVKIDPPGAGYVTITPAPESGTQHNWYFPHGTTVYVTAHQNLGYHFKNWSGEMTDTTEITAPVYPMTEKRTITAHFEIEKVIEFSLSKPTAYPYRAPPGPVLITCPVTSRSSINVTAQVKLIVYEGSALPEHGTKLWESTQAITISPNETKNVQFGRMSEVGTIDRRDVEVEVYVEGRLIKESEWDDVFYVKETPPVGISFQVSIWGIPDFGDYDYWSCYYYDPGISDFVGIGNWYRSYSKIAFSNVKSGGYFAIFLKRNTAISPQYTSPTLSAVDGGSYTFDIEKGVIYG